MVKSFRSRILLLVISITFFTLLVVLVFVIGESKASLTKSQKENATNLVNSINMHVETEYRSLIFHQESSLEIRKSELKNIVLIATTILNSYYNKYKSGILNEKEAKKQAINEIKKIRYSDGVGYVWINDTSEPYPKMIMHPTLPELDNTFLKNPEFNCALGIDKNLFVAFNDVCRENGEGFVDYLWPKPTADGLTSKQPKISYVKLFREWDWILGSGVYIDDIDRYAEEKLNEIIRELRSQFLNIMIGETGYMFIFDGNRRVIIHPRLEGEEQSKMINPRTGNNILDELKIAAKNPDSPFVYFWSKPNDETQKMIHKKHAYVKYFEPLDWYIASSYYVDEIEKPAKKLSQKLITLSMLFLALAILLSMQLSRSISKPLLKLTEATRILSKKGIYSTKIPVSGSSEIKELGHVLDKLIKSVIQKEKKISEGEQKFKAIFNQTFQFNGLLDLNGRMLEINKTTLDLTNKKEDDFVGKYLWDTPLWGESGSLKQKVKESIFEAAKGKFIRFEVKHVKRNGKTIFVDFSIKPIHDKNGVITMLLPEGRDITNIKIAEKNLKEAKELLEVTMDSIPDIIGIQDKEHNILKYNKAGNEYFNLISKTNIKGKCYELLGYDEPCNNCSAEIVYRTGKIAETIKFNDRLKIWFNMRAYPIFDNDGNVVKVIEHLRDITDQIKSEEEIKKLNKDLEKRVLERTAQLQKTIENLKKAQDKLIQSEKMASLGSLVAGVAHEINTPVGIGVSLASNLDERTKLIQEHFLNSTMKKSDLQKYFLTASESSLMILNNLRRASDLIKSFKQVAVDQTSEGKRTFNLKAYMNEILSSLHNLIKKSNHNIEIDIDENLVLDSYPGVYSQIITNLILNSFKHGFENKLNGVINIYAENKDNCLIIKYKDNGKGLTKENQLRIFDPFYTTKRGKGGSGLGMNIVYNLITGKLNGSIECISDVGKGVIFTIKIPYNKLEDNKEIKDFS